MTNSRAICNQLLLIVILLAGCGGEKTNKLPTSGEQKITAITAADAQRLTDERAVIEAFLSNEDSKRKYRTAAGKLGTIRAILEAGKFKPEQTYELQCLGVVLGDAFVQELGMEWVIVADEFGRNASVRMPGTTIILFPLTMISKRVERGEKVDVFDVFNRAAEDVERLQQQGI
jgi:hypothetical protein